MIRIQNLTKNFRRNKALDDLNFSIRRGEATALWGSNGAGKTTLLRCLLGVIPFDGEILVSGMSIRSHAKEIRKSTGFVPQDISLHDNFTVGETLNFYARLKKTAISSIGKWYEMLGIGDYAHKMIRELSGGMKQKIALAIALLGNPPVLLLDEPTANLDLKTREYFLQLLGLLRKEGKTIIFCSHRMEEVLSFADRVLVLDNGKLIADSTPMDIYKKFGRNGLLRIYLHNSTAEDAVDLLNGKGYASSMNGRGIKVKVDPGAKIEPIRILLDYGIPIENFDYEVELF